MDDLKSYVISHLELFDKKKNRKKEEKVAEFVSLLTFLSARDADVFTALALFFDNGKWRNVAAVCVVNHAFSLAMPKKQIEKTFMELLGDLSDGEEVKLIGDGFRVIHRCLTFDLLEDKANVLDKCQKLIIQ